jgi:hypothetical protein
MGERRGPLIILNMSLFKYFLLVRDASKRTKKEQQRDERKKGNYVNSFSHLLILSFAFRNLSWTTNTSTKNNTLTPMAINQEK